jgi:glyoxylase-like metal-dependent hydrolase (beta-lactamase superfamily II)
VTREVVATRRIGDIEMTAFSDGPFPAALDSFVEFERAEVERLTGMAIDQQMILAVNCYLLKVGGRTVLVDTGCGQSMGPALGQLPKSLRAFGVAPEMIDSILLTHIHPDHALGLTDADGRAVYPNAELVVHEQEARFWLEREPSAGATERIRRNIVKGQAATAPYRARLRTVRDGEGLPGVAATLLAGHTPGHTGWLIHSGKDAVLVWGDTVHLAAVQVPRPEAALVFDVDPQLARETRMRTFDRAAADRLCVAGAHLDYPGFGYIERRGAGYRFVSDH